MIKYLAVIVFLVASACGDNIKPDLPGPGPNNPEVGEDLDKWPDDYALDAGSAEELADAGQVEDPDDPDVDAGAGGPSDKAACCNGLLNGNVPFQCGTPPGTCRFVTCDGVEFRVCAD